MNQCEYALQPNSRRYDCALKLRWYQILKSPRPLRVALLTCFRDFHAAATVSNCDDPFDRRILAQALPSIIDPAPARAHAAHRRCRSFQALQRRLQSCGRRRDVTANRAAAARDRGSVGTTFAQTMVVKKLSSRCSMRRASAPTWSPRDYTRASKSRPSPRILRIRPGEREHGHRSRPRSRLDCARSALRRG